MTDTPHEYQRWAPDRWDEEGRPFRRMVDKAHPIPSGMDLLPEVTVTDLAEFLESDPARTWAWDYAYTMPEAPHYYVIRGKTVPSRKYSLAFALIAAFGEADTYHGRARVYLYNANRTARWWVMSDYPSRSRVLNMAVLADQPGQVWA